MRLVNFCVGKVATVNIGAQRTRTAHVKAPVLPPWIVTPEGAAGDERAVHPDKLYAFPRSGYDYWAAELGVRRAAWPDGFFGENLTLDELDEDAVHVGDVFEIGPEVVVCVSGARTPCAKLAWRLDQPRAFQKVFALSKHTGMYLGVIRGGAVRAGDKLRRTHHDPAMPTIAEVCQWVASSRPPPPDRLARLLAYEGLSPTIRLLLGARVESARLIAARDAGRWSGWRPFAVARVVEECSGVRSLHLRPADGGPLCVPLPGQFVTARLGDAAEGFIERCWSLSDETSERGLYRLTVKRDRGPGSRWVHEARVGDPLDLRAPSGHFNLDLGSPRPPVLIAAGIGITPLYAMLRAHLARRQTPIHLFYAARTAADAAFHDDLAALEREHPNLRCRFFFSRSAEAPRRLTAEAIVASLDDLSVTLGGRSIALPFSEADFYLCGPPGFCGEVRTRLVELGANPDHVYHESFVRDPGRPAACQSAVVRFRRSGIEAAWTSDEDLTLLELAERAGVTVENDCRAGTCLSCRTALADGRTTADLADGTSLLCIGRPDAPLVVLDC
jgi:ferredoxin-NADP reductase/MOSC domain-containing protein YiiM